MDEDPAVPLSKQFQAEGAGIVLEKDITFYSTCEHHLMPFFGKPMWLIFRTARWWA